jgi:hypothetical protein
MNRWMPARNQRYSASAGNGDGPGVEAPSPPELNQRGVSPVRMRRLHRTQSAGPALRAQEVRPLSALINRLGRPLALGMLDEQAAIAAVTNLTSRAGAVPFDPKLSRHLLRQAADRFANYRALDEMRVRRAVWPLCESRKPGEQIMARARATAPTPCARTRCSTSAERSPAPARGGVPMADPIWDDPKVANLHKRPSSNRLKLRAASLPDPATIPPRQWLYGTQLLRGFVSVLVAPGGTGKSAYAMAVATAIASGRPILGENIFARVNVAVLNLEEPLDELDRRLAAICIRHKVCETEIAGPPLPALRRRPAHHHGGHGDDGFEVISPDEEALVEEIKATTSASSSWTRSPKATRSRRTATRT